MPTAANAIQVAAAWKAWKKKLQKNNRRRAPSDDLESFLSARGLTFANTASFQRAARRAEERLLLDKLTRKHSQGSPRTDDWRPLAVKDAAVCSMLPTSSPC